MRYRTHIALLAAGGVTSSALGLGVFAWPAWQDRTQADAERADLEQRIAGLSDKTAEVTVLADELDRRRNALRSALKYIPETPDIATLIGTLSLPADGVTVLDQTFTAGAPGDAIIEDPGDERVVPLTVDLHARFDAIFALMRAAESMDRLVRVASVRLAVDPKRADEEPRMLEGSVGLEVVYLSSEDE